MTQRHPRDHKQYKRKRGYPRVRRDDLLDGHEAINNRLRKRIAETVQLAQHNIRANGPEAQAFKRRLSQK